MLKMLDTILQGDAHAALETLPDRSVDCCVTSPPYYLLRDYGVSGQIGLEPTLEEYLDNLLAVFKEVKRVLKDEGTLWLNMGDSYAGNSTPGGGDPTIGSRNLGGSRYHRKSVPKGLKSKNLLGLPWRVAFMLQADGWILRSDIIWHKRNSMPESVKDRPTKAHEYIFLMAKEKHYYYNADAIKERAIAEKPPGNKNHHADV